MNLIIQRARLLICCVLAGAFAFMLLGYIAKLIPALAIGVALIWGAVNVFGIYLFIFYPDLREEVSWGLAAELLGGLMLWM